MTDVELVRRCLERDDRAWSAFVKLYGGSIRHGVKAHVLSQDVEDAVSWFWCHFFARDMRQLRMWDPERTALNSWVTFLAVNAGAEFYRASGRRPIPVDDHDVVEKDGATPSPLDALLAREQMHLTRESVAKLGEQWLRFFDAQLDGLSTEETAAELGTAKVTVYTRRARLAGMLRNGGRK